MRDKLPSMYRRLPILKKEEIYPLITLAQNGCHKSLQKIVEHNLGLIPKEANIFNSFGNPMLDFDDLFQEGVTGLHDAIRKFDITLNFEFSTYAKFWIQQRIRRYVKNHRKPIRIPIYATEIIITYEKIKKEHPDKEKEFWIEETAKKHKYPLKSIYWLIESKLEMKSLNETNEEGHEVNIAYEVFNQDYYDTLDFQYLMKVVDLLPKRSKDVLIQRCEGRTLDSIAQDYNLSRECVRLIEKKAILRIRQLLKSSLKKAKG